ncbi:hypothetical protein AB1L88_05750 [Tautonia sp. JC769]|uniref:hypothetical protein n=1 Tax=Tautonia sp. JC769 TaxID=3232135 RepID=UPI00345A4922
MDRPLSKRSLIAVSGLALMVATSGCRDRNLNVPPPAHYTDGTQAIPEAIPYADAPPLSSAPASLDPYAGASLGTPRSYDPSATQASGLSGAMGGASAASASAYDPTAGYGVPPVAGSAAPMTNAGGPFASPSSPSPHGAAPFAAGSAGAPFSGTAPAAGASSYGALPLPGDAGAAGLPTPAEFPGLDGLDGAPPIPDDLPEMP